MTTTLEKIKPRIEIWHNILWSKYKGEVFSSLHALNSNNEFDIQFIQIAETEGSRISLGTVDLMHHRYPFDLIFKGSIDNISIIRRVTTLFLRTLRSDADLFLLTGYEKIECWLQFLLIRLKGKKAALFCDSTIHDNKQTTVKGLLKRLIFRSANGIFAYGLRTQEYVVHYGAAPEKVFHGCQSAALPLGYTPEQALSDRLILAPMPNSPRYLYVGRLSHEKALDSLLQAFARVKTQIPAAMLIIVGDGPERKNLEALAECLTLRDCVCFAGRKSGVELFKEYSRATCCMLPSRSEPWGLVINESLSYGCPAIVSERCGCVPELVDEGNTGFLHKVDDIADLSAKMIAAPDFFSNIEKSARICIDHMKNYRPEAAATQILEGIRKILCS